MKIGIPRALLYYRYRVLWETYFTELGMEVVISPPTNKAILDIGERCSIDENCLSSKLFFGHVSSLEGKCDAVFVPRIANYGKDGIMCSRFEALYDICVNTFRETTLSFITCDVDGLQHRSEAAAYIHLAVTLGKTKEQGRSAYRTALNAWEKDRQEYIIRQQAELKKADAIKVLVVGHAYNLHDAYIGQPIIKQIRQLYAIPVCSDTVDLKQARVDGKNICNHVPWIMNRELFGAIDKYRNEVDGIILITAFPCGPDSMTNEMTIRRVKEMPILNLLLDSQDGMAGIETRLESFIDIIRFRKEMLL